MDWIYIWLIVVAVSLIVEFSTMELVSIWCAIAGLITMISAFFLPEIVQIIIFFTLSIGLLIGFRKIALKYLLKNNKFKSNSDNLIGKSCKLLTDINEDNAGGSVKINDVVWTAVSASNEPIEKNKKVKIIEIKGNKLVVEEIKEEKEN